MELFGKAEHYSKFHHKMWMDPLRLAFGIFLLIKGLYYIGNTDYLMKILQSNFNLKDIEVIASMVIAFFHVFLGCFILLGIGTRVACLILIPIVLIAIPFSNYHLVNPLSLLLSVVSLALCVFFFIQGSGKFSVYAYLSNPNKQPENMTTPMENEK